MQTIKSRYVAEMSNKGNLIDDSYTLKCRKE